MKTIYLKGKRYAQVVERIKEAHKDNKNISIITNIQWIGEKGFISVKAEIKTEKGMFTGHSFGKGAKEKGVEKLETVAVGRALAFAGYLADGEIASYEEIKDYLENNN